MADTEGYDVGGEARSRTRQTRRFISYRLAEYWNVMNKHHPYHPIIYVRGFAATSDEIEETVADPYMGFNLGSTKTRQFWDGRMRKFFFESPLVRLKDEPVWIPTPRGLQRSEQRYDDVYVNGEDLTAPDPANPRRPARSDIALPYQSIVIFRYYDEASQAFGSGETPPIEHFAKELSALILRLKELVCRKGKHPLMPEKQVDNQVDPDDFRVYLIAHSMGGLVCRAFLQNPPDPEATVARNAVDKLFTYATPHNGIDLRIVRNVPGWATFGDANNFNRVRMAGYFGLQVPPNPDPNKIDVSVVQNFDPSRIFNLVGTNPADYVVMRGLSSWAAGERSDGLVRAENATTHGTFNGKEVESPRAYAFRSHSGHYGIVNSEEGYQNLTRFFFGLLRADGVFEVDEVMLPQECDAELARGGKVRASYQFEIVVSVRGTQWQLHRRTVRDNSAILRTYEELFPPNAAGVRVPDRTKSPHLFSLFLDPRKSMRTDVPPEQRSIAFAFDVAVLVPDYEIDGVLWLKEHFEGGFIYREQIVVEAMPDGQGGWIIRHRIEGAPSRDFKDVPVNVLPNGGWEWTIPIVRDTRPGIKGRLRLTAQPWNT
jgi:hypothetical protein